LNVDTLQLLQTSEIYMIIDRYDQVITL
jgi:hypothetical protein